MLILEFLYNGVLLKQTPGNQANLFLLTGVSIN